MPVEIIKKDVDGTEYEFSYLKPSRALALQARLAKFLLGPLGQLLSGAGGDLLNTELSQLGLSQAALMLAQNIDESMVLETVKELIGTVRHKTGQPVNFEADFLGKQMHLLKVVAAALEVNYGDFFDALKEKLPVMRKQTLTPENQA